MAVIARLHKTSEGQVEKFAAAVLQSRRSEPAFHIVLATYEDDADIAALDAALARAIQPWTQLSVSASGFVLYPGQPSSIEMLPIPIHRLLRLHVEVDAALLAAAGRHCFEHGIWTPTVPLGHTAHESDSVETLVRLYNEPIEVTLNRIELVRDEPFGIISSRMLPP